MSMKQITNQKELDALCKKGIKKDEEIEIVGEGLRFNSNLEVFGFLKISVKVDMDWGRHAELRESSHAVLWESSHAVLWGSSHAVLWGSSHAELRGSSHAVLRGSSHAVLRESSHAELRELSCSWNYSVEAKLVLFGWAVGYKMFEGKGNITKKVKTATIIEIPPMGETFVDFENRYPVEVKGKIATLYKALHKKGDAYFSEYDNSFTYEIGKVYEHECAPSSSGSCAEGLHIAHKSWARCFGIGWSNFALVECEVAIKDIVVSKDCDGKVRCSKLKIIREVPENKWYV